METLLKQAQLILKEHKDCEYVDVYNKGVAVGMANIIKLIKQSIKFNKPKSKAKIIKKYTINITVNKRGKLKVDMSNYGFTAFELIGLLYNSISDIQEQINGNIKPDIVNRKLVKDD